MGTNNSTQDNFGFTKGPSYYQSRIGKALFIITGSFSKSGIVQKIEDEHIFLCPYVGNDYSSGKPVMCLRPEAARIRLDSITGSDELTLADLKGYCIVANRDYADKEEERAAKQQERNSKPAKSG